MRLWYSYFGTICLLLMSCSNEELLHEYEKLTPIKFSSLCIDITTKAENSLSSPTLPPDIAVSIYSLQHPLDSYAKLWSPKQFINTLGRTDINGDILYDNTFYFPLNEELDFFAVHPYISAETTGYNYDDTQTTTIILKEKVANQYDLMYASLLNQSKKSPVLVFKFKHLLSQITLNIIKAPSIIVGLPLTKVEINAPQNATFDIWNGELSNLTEQTTYTLDTNMTLDTDETLIPGQFLLFPKKADEIILTFGNDENNIFHVTLSGEPLEWEPGVNYQYNITISRNIPESISTATPVDNTENTPVDNTPVNNETTTDPNNVAPVTKAIAPNTVMVYRSID